MRTTLVGLRARTLRMAGAALVLATAEAAARHVEDRAVLIVVEIVAADFGNERARIC